MKEERKERKQMQKPFNPTMKILSRHIGLFGFLQPHLGKQIGLWKLQQRVLFLGVWAKQEVGQSEREKVKERKGIFFSLVL